MFKSFLKLCGSGRCSRRSRRRALRFEMFESRRLLAANAIVTENLLPGSPASEWDIVGAGDPSIQGFATEISVDQGASIAFKINDTSLAPYRLDIYRIGYYGGLGARKVGEIPSSQTLRQSQPAPLTDPATGLVDAGNWSVSTTWTVPQTATSGVYIAKATREDTGGASHIIFVVRDDDGESELLFQTSDTTWQAYNRWGGNSLYTGPIDGRSYAVSYNRPFDTRATTAKDWFFSSEYAMVRWVEKNGYDVSYFTGVDSDRFGSEILEHDVFLSVGHDEYWSANQRANVEAARDAGVNLAFFSGNEVYWKTRWETSTDASGTPFRTLVTYKETWANAKIDPEPNTWTGTWRDDRFSPPADGGYPENALTGQIFTVNRGPGGDTGTPFEVPAEYADLRMWRNTRVADLQPGQKATLGDFVLGYEWDEDLDNGFRPAGLIRMSSTTQNVPQKIDQYGGPIATPGTATHSLTMYRAESGALVFGAGTINWTWGLDGTHDVIASVPDSAIQQATVNLFADMGVAPTTLQPELTYPTRSIDIVAPTSIVTSVSGGTTTLLSGVPVVISGTASDSGGVVASVEVSLDGGQTWHRAQGTGTWNYTWTPSTAGPHTILSRAVDDSANRETVAAGFNVSVQLTATATTGLVAAYGFDEGSGSTLGDSSGNNNVGVISGATFVPGFSGQALSFDGVNDLVTIADSNSLDLSTGLTIEAWVQPKDLIGWSTVVLKERSGNALSYALYASDNTSNPPAGYVDSSPNQGSVRGASPLQLDVWSHLAVTYDAQFLKMYVNGILVNQSAVSGNLTTSSQPLRIGGNTVYADEYFRGLIDEVRIYNRPLSSAELLANMSVSVGGTVDSLAPTASITSPVNNSSVSGIATINVAAADNVAVGTVWLYLNGALLSTDSSAPYQTILDTRNLSNGSYTLAGQVLDIRGNWASIPPVNFSVANPADLTAPTVRPLYPHAEQRIGGVIALATQSSDNVGVAGVQFSVNGTNIGTERTTAPYQVIWDSSSVADGNYQLTSVSRDAAGNTTSRSVAVTVDNSAPTIISQTPASGQSNVALNIHPSVTLDESIRASEVQFELRTGSGQLISASVQYNDASRQLTLIPDQDLSLNATYSVTLSGLQDLAGNEVATLGWSFATSAIVTNAHLWNDATTPAVASANETTAVEVGVRFRAAVDGYVTGIRFYKGPSNNGTHIGKLWSNTGTLLGSVNFTSETATGWQNATFSSPIAVTANTDYVASYFAPVGGYAIDSEYFVNSFTNGPLTAPANSTVNGNGLFLYGQSGGFPGNSFNASNYWVDVAFSNVITDTTAPTLTSVSLASESTNGATNTVVVANFSEPIIPSTLAFVLQDSLNNTVNASVTFSNGNRQATLTPASLLTQGAVYTVTLSGAQDAAGNTMQSFTQQFTTHNSVDLQSPILIDRFPVASATGVALNSNVVATFNEPLNPSTIAFTLSAPGVQSVSGQLSYDAATRTITFDPATEFAPLTTYTVLTTVSDLAGNSTNVGWSFDTGSAVTNATIFGPSAVPAVASASDSSPVELGVKFRAVRDGYITGIRFYKGTSNTGTHLGHLWSASGSLLGSATFENETSGGWQQVTFGSPIPVTANTTYVASYYAPNGGYASNSAYFAGGSVTNNELTALGQGVEGGNGVYRYGVGGGFPSLSFNATNYWVDVVFATTLVNPPPPSSTVISRSPAADATNVPPTSTVRATFSEPIQASSITFVLQDPNGSSVPANVVYDDSTQTITLTPSNILSENLRYTATLSGGLDASGNVLADTTWSFTTGGQVSDVSLWNLGASPTVASANDTSSLELGVKFQADRDGFLTGLRFYKGPSNTGTHIGNLWSRSGTLLRSATFTAESAEGWQTLRFDLPLAISANTTYVASYFAPNGSYAYDHAYFSVPFVNGALRALATGEDGGNGVYRYGGSSSFPDQNYNSSNYWVDVVFSQTLGDVAPPTVTSQSPAPATNGVATVADIDVTFSEAVQPATISFQLKDPFGSIVPAELSYDASTRRARLNPTTDLLPLTTYTATLQGATDTAGNEMAPVTWTFTVQGIWGQTTLDDFSSGAHAGTVATNAGGGALQLATAFSDDFQGTGLAAAIWGTGAWSTQNAISVENGSLSIQGSHVFSVATYAEQTVEGQISFGAAPYQHFGMATGFDTTAGNYWAIFSTGNTSNTLFARVNALGTSQQVDLGALPTGFHTYRIAPTASGFEFYVDGVLRTTMSGAFPGGTQLRVALSAYNGAPSPALQADSIRLVNVVAPPDQNGLRLGVYQSVAFDAGQRVDWQSVNWTAEISTGTGIKVEVLISDDANFGGAVWLEVTNGQSLSALGLRGRYLKYRVTLSTSDELATSKLFDIDFTWF